MIQLALIMLTGLFARHDRLRQEESGASVLEWAMIAAVSVALAAAIGYAITQAVNGGVTKINNCGDGTC